MVREADGYQAHLVSPEYGLRRLVDEAIGMVLEPVNTCVRRVHQVLLDAARCALLMAALRAGTLISPSLHGASAASRKALQSWGCEGHQVRSCSTQSGVGLSTVADFKLHQPSGLMPWGRACGCRLLRTGRLLPVGSHRKCGHEPLRVIELGHGHAWGCLGNVVDFLQRPTEASTAFKG